MLIFLAFLISFSSSADQTSFERYSQSKGVFWKKVYSKNQKSLYCQKSAGKRHKGLNIEHVFAASWMKESITACKYKNRKECRKISARFNLMEADLHNMYPALSTVNSARGSYPFGTIEGEPIKDSCATELGDKLVEPSDYAKGRVARSVLYMAYEYNLNVDALSNSPGLENELLNWHCKFPPSPREIIRHQRITEIQNTSNPFVFENFCS